MLPHLSKSLGNAARQVDTLNRRPSSSMSSATTSYRSLRVVMSRSGCSRLARSRRAPHLVLVLLSTLQRRWRMRFCKIRTRQPARRVWECERCAHLNRLMPLSLDEQVPIRVGWMSSSAAAVAWSMCMCVSLPSS